MTDNPHRNQPFLTGGAPFDRARGDDNDPRAWGYCLRHTALATDLAQPAFAYFAPQAANNTWYPNRFLEPIAGYEPWLSSALAVVEEALARVAQANIPPRRTTLLGFSQGACLTLEFAARHAQRYGGIIGLSGGLIGPDGTPRDYAGSLAGTPVFLGCSDADFHIPKERVDHTAEVLRRLGGEVTERLYPNMGHAVNEDELSFVRGLMRRVASDEP